MGIILKHVICVFSFKNSREIREADPDGFFFDHTLAEGESDCEEDPFSNGYLTEDEIVFDEDYVPAYVVAGTCTHHFLLGEGWPW